MSLKTSVMGVNGSEEVISTMAKLSVEEGVGALRSGAEGMDDWPSAADSTSGTASPYATDSATGAMDDAEGTLWRTAEDWLRLMWTAWSRGRGCRKVWGTH